MLMLSCLEKEGLVTCNRGASVGQVVGWRHQKIDKPMASKHEGVIYQWDTPSDSSNVRRAIPTIRRKDRIGEDRIVTTTKSFSAGVEDAWKIWCETLKYFNIDPGGISPPQESSIARAIKSLGYENTVLALEGARYEPNHEKFNPKQHLSIERILHRDAKGQSRWEKFVNLAKANREVTKIKEIDYAKIATGEI